MIRSHAEKPSCELLNIGMVARCVECYHRRKTERLGAEHDPGILDETGLFLLHYIPDVTVDAAASGKPAADRPDGVPMAISEKELLEEPDRRRLPQSEHPEGDQITRRAIRVGKRMHGPTDVVKSLYIAG